MRILFFMFMFMLPVLAISQTVEAHFPNNQFSVICTKAPKEQVYDVQISYGSTTVHHKCSVNDIETVEINCHSDIMQTIKTIEGAVVELIGTRNSNNKIDYNGFNFRFKQIDISSILPPSKVIIGKQYMFTFSADGVWVKNLTKFKEGFESCPVFYQITERGDNFVKLQEGKLLYYDKTYYLYKHPTEMDASGKFETSEKYTQ